MWQLLPMSAIRCHIQSTFSTYGTSRKVSDRRPIGHATYNLHRPINENTYDRWKPTELFAYFCKHRQPAASMKNITGWCEHWFESHSLPCFADTCRGWCLFIIFILIIDIHETWRNYLVNFCIYSKLLRKRHFISLLTVNVLFYIAFRNGMSVVRFCYIQCRSFLIMSFVVTLLLIIEVHVLHFLHINSMELKFCGVAVFLILGLGLSLLALDENWLLAETAV